MPRRYLSVFAGVLGVVAAVACGPRERTGGAPSVTGDTSFVQLTHQYFEDYYRRQPTRATYLGIHTYDDRLEDYSRQAVQEALKTAKDFRQRVAAIDSGTLSESNQLDREQLLHELDSRVLTLETIRPWERDADSYSSGVTNSAYIMIKRRFAPPEVRLKNLIAREKAVPAALAEARRNLDNPPKIFTEIAIEQIDGNRAFFETAVAAAFPEVTDPALVAEFKAANDAVIAALADYKKWLAEDLLPRSNGSFAIGADAYRRKLLADEMIDVPLDELLRMAEQDLRRNQAAFLETATTIDSRRPALEVLKAVESQHPPADKLLAVTQSELDAVGKFMTANKIITIPDAAPVQVQETPPFLRATTTASMEIPGPFETVATEAYYNMTLPDPKWPDREKEAFMSEWYYALITNVSVHEVWPGHYLQFLYARHLPSEARKILGSASNTEGWAHYCEQMVVEQGFHGDDPRYRLAQIQDALLRNARFVVGIKLHTQGMTVSEAEQYFVKEAYQPASVARTESKRGTGDPTYGYYTMGKLMILKLRDDYRARMGARFSLQDFHDKFISLGPLSLPLMRRAMLGETGQLFPRP
jgi:uncharacterized protein (DUF885 family)